MIPIVICDDDLGDRKLIEKAVLDCISENTLDIELKLSTAKGEDIVDYLEKGNADFSIYILDVELQSRYCDGIGLGRDIRVTDSDSYIVYVTAHKDAALMTYENELDCTSFILKDDAEKMKERISACLVKINGQIKNKSLRVSISYRNHIIFLENIIYIEAEKERHRVVICYKNKAEMLDRVDDFYGSLKELYALLPENFFHCHRSVIINLSKVEYIDEKKRKIFLYGNCCCDASDKFLRELKKKYTRFIPDGGRYTETGL